MTVNKLIEQLQGIKEAEGGDIEVFLDVGGQETLLVQTHVGRAEHMISEHVYQGHCEDYHQCVALTGN
jgi:hypothetical protein